MPNARGEITTSDVRRMLALKAEGVATRRIAEIIGINRRTVDKYLCAPEMVSRAHRYAAFVERAAQLGAPLLVPPSPSPF